MRSGSDEKEETLREEEVSACEQEPRAANSQLDRRHHQRTTVQPTTEIPLEALCAVRHPLFNVYRGSIVLQNSLVHCERAILETLTRSAHIVSCHAAREIISTQRETRRESWLFLSC